MRRLMAISLGVATFMALVALAFTAMDYSSTQTRRSLNFSINHYPQVKRNSGTDIRLDLHASTKHATQNIATANVADTVLSKKTPASPNDAGRLRRLRALKSILIAKIMRFDPGHKRDAQILGDIASGKVAAIRQRLSAGLSPNAKLIFGAKPGESETLLEAAISFDQADIAKMLLNSGASVGGGGWMTAPLAMASMEGEGKVVAALLEHGANPNQANGIGITALSEAVREGHYSVVKTLVAAGANIHDALAGNGTVPWYVTQNTSPNYIAIKKFLIAHGAIPSGN